MKKSIIFVSAVLCLMLSSCGTDVEQTALESVITGVAIVSQSPIMKKQLLHMKFLTFVQRSSACGIYRDHVLYTVLHE